MNVMVFTNAKVTFLTAIKKGLEILKAFFYKFNLA